VTENILSYQNIDHAVLSLGFVTHQKIRALNKKYLDRAEVTDVLAFDLSVDNNFIQKNNMKGKKILVGEILISTDAVIGNSREYKTSKSEELVLYLVHGILHLLGYDDHSEKDIQRMRRREKKIMDFLGNNIKRVIR